MFKPTYLYIKTHNKTGLKYFGKTSSRNPMTYKGSGKRWLNHLNLHGCDITTEIIGHFKDEISCKETAIAFSIENNIVESTHWANLEIEDGINGGFGLEGEKNSQYGKIWITNGIDNKKINNKDNIPTGWYKGRKVPIDTGEKVRNKLKGRTLEDIIGIDRAKEGRRRRSLSKLEYHSKKNN
jgi:hypothetical protein